MAQASVERFGPAGGWRVGRAACAPARADLPARVVVVPGPRFARVTR